MKKKQEIIILFIMFSFFIFFVSSNTLAIYKSSGSGSITETAADYIVKVNNSTNTTQIVNLQNTITSNPYSNDYVVPGSEGQFNVTLDFTGTQTKANYVIDIIPTDPLDTNAIDNIVFYSNAARTQAISPSNQITGNFTMNGTNTFTHTIYWKWNYIDSAQTNAEESALMNSSISTISLSITTSQTTGGV